MPAGKLSSRTESEHLGTDPNTYRSDPLPMKLRFQDSMRPALLTLFASRLDGRRRLQIARQLVRLECFDVHLDEAGKGAAEVWPVTAAAIDDDSDPGDGSAMSADNVD